VKVKEKHRQSPKGNLNIMLWSGDTNSFVNVYTTNIPTKYNHLRKSHAI
jgi:hypothetical protein